MTAYTVVTFTGVESVINLTFPYISKSHVNIYLDGALVSPSSYSWNSASQVQLTAGAPAAGVVGEARRVTPASPVVTYVAGPQQADDLNMGDRQSRYMAEESQDIASRLDAATTVTVAAIEALAEAAADSAEVAEAAALAAIVDNQGAIGGYEDVKTGNYAIVGTDIRRTIVANKATAIGFTLGALSSYASTFQYRVFNMGAGDLTVTPDGAETINGAASLVLKQYEGAVIYKSADGARWRALTNFGSSIAIALGLKLSLVGGNLSGNLVMDNNVPLQGKTTGGVARNLVSITGSDQVEVGTVALATNIRGVNTRPNYNGSEQLALFSDLATQLAAYLPLAGGNLSAAITMANNNYYQAKDTGGTSYVVAGISSSNTMNLATPSLITNLRGSGVRPNYNTTESLALLSDMTGTEKRVLGATIFPSGADLDGSASGWPHGSIDAIIPANCVRILWGVYGMMGTAGVSMGLRLGSGSITIASLGGSPSGPAVAAAAAQYDTSGYRSGHSKVKDATANSVSQSGTFFVLGGSDNTTDEFYGQICLERVTDGSNRWSLSSVLNSYDGSKIERRASGIKPMSDVLGLIAFYGGAGSITAGTINPVYWVLQ